MGSELETNFNWDDYVLITQIGQKIIPISTSQRRMWREGYFEAIRGPRESNLQLVAQKVAVLLDYPERTWLSAKSLSSGIEEDPYQVSIHSPESSRADLIVYGSGIHEQCTKIYLPKELPKNLPEQFRKLKNFSTEEEFIQAIQKQEVLLGRSAEKEPLVWHNYKRGYYPLEGHSLELFKNTKSNYWHLKK
jgi:hypothetical protein